MRDQFISTLKELAYQDRRIVLITGDLGFGVLDSFAKELPGQFINAGVAEQNMTGIATGMALEGRVVFTYSIANFSTLRCFEQIRNDAAYHDVNVNVVSVGGGFSYGSLGMSHHATEDLSIMRSIPIDVVAPCSNWEAQEATKAIINSNKVSYLRLDKSQADAPCLYNEKFELGKARWLRKGADLTIVATGGIVQEALNVADSLVDDGISIGVLSMHTIKPIDSDAILDAVKSTGGILTLEEHCIDGGLGSAVAEVCMDNHMYPDIFYRFALRNGFSSIVGSQTYLRSVYSLDAQAIKLKISSILSKRSCKYKVEV